MTLTLTMPVELWMAAALVVFVGGKILQQGGISYASGKVYTLETMIGVFCLLGVIIPIGLALLIQNGG